MDEVWARLGLVVGALIVAGVATLVLRSRAKGEPRKLAATGLAQGIYLFTSKACPDCRHVRGMLDDALGPEKYTELSWELEPGMFHELGVDGVPGTLIVEVDGSGVLWPGRPDKALTTLGKLLGP
ncbi:MAG: hypothetical protein V3U46_08645 [Acidimicrobiia bacterium]